MNYFDYMNELKPNDALKNRTKAKVQLEISKQNHKRYTIKKAYISIAACFIVLVASVFTAGALTKNSGYIEGPEESSTKNFFSEKILINTTLDESEEYPQEILIEDHLYLQYQKEDTKSIEDSKLEINKADIGELLYTIDESNLVDAMKTLGGSETKAIKKNKFCNAKVYKLNNYKNNTALLVKEENKEEYYLFYLIDERNSITD